MAIIFSSISDIERFPNLTLFIKIEIPTLFPGWANLTKKVGDPFFCKKKYFLIKVFPYFEKLING